MKRGVLLGGEEEREKERKKVKKGISLVNGLCMNEPRTVECGGVGVGVWGGRPRGGCTVVWSLQLLRDGASTD